MENTVEVSCVFLLSEDVLFYLFVTLHELLIIFFSLISG